MIDLRCGDCLEVLPTLPECSVDSVVCDPPYEIGFMGKQFDKTGISFCPETWQAVLRVAKPGAILLAFGGTRTWHRLACAIEDAGWELKDTLMWLHGMGMPKSLNISKAIDKAAGAEREVTGKKVYADGTVGHTGNRTGDSGWARPFMEREDWQGKQETAPATAAAKLWDGLASAMKPAWEPVILAMKPLDGNFVNNALRHGVAGLNIDGCRIGTNDDTARHNNAGTGNIENWRTGARESNTGGSPQGRYPANLLFTHHESCELVGKKKVKAHKHSGKPGNGKDGRIYGRGKVFTGETPCYADANGQEEVDSWECALGCPCGHCWPSTSIEPCPDCGCRKTFWICPVKMLDEQSGTRSSGKLTAANQINGGFAGTKHCYGKAKEGGSGSYEANSGGASRFFFCSKASRRERGEGNTHPCIKPLKLMEYLCRLTMTPTGGVVLDPFMGSGSTALACINVGRDFIGIEKDKGYFAIAERRIKAAQAKAEPDLFAKQEA